MKVWTWTWNDMRMMTIFHIPLLLGCLGSHVGYFGGLGRDLMSRDFKNPPPYNGARRSVHFATSGLMDPCRTTI